MTHMRGYKVTSGTPNKVDIHAALYALNGLKVPKRLGKKRLIKVAKWLEKHFQAA